MDSLKRLCHSLEAEKNHLVVTEEEKIKFSCVINLRIDADYKGLEGKIESAALKVAEAMKRGRCSRPDFARGEINIISQYQKQSKVSDTPPQREVFFVPTLSPPLLQVLDNLPFIICL